MRGGALRRDLSGTAQRTLVALLSGVAVAWALPPHGLWGLHWVAHAPLLVALRGAGPGERVWLCSAHALACMLLVFAWIGPAIQAFFGGSAATPVALHLVGAGLSGLPLVAGLLLAEPMRRRLGAAWVVALPCWVVCWEWAMEHVLPFPINLGLSQGPNLPVWQLSAWTGIWGISWLLVCVNALLAELWSRGRPVAWRWPLAVFAGLLLVVGLGQRRIGAVERLAAEAETRRVALLQSDHTATERLQQTDLDTLRYWAAETVRLGRAADLVLWPESAVGLQLDSSAPVFRLWELAETVDADLLVGVRFEAGDGAFNAAFGFDRTRLRPDRVAAAGQGARARVEQVLGSSEVVDAIADRLLSDPVAWSRWSAITAGCTHPLQPSTAELDGDRIEWVGRAAAPATGSCAGVYLRCLPGDACRSYPAPSRYDKIDRFPLGEYLPGDGVVPWHWLVDGPRAAVRPGSSAEPLTVAGLQVATPICYEGALRRSCERFVAPEMWVNLTNDTWFGHTAASELQLLVLSARAVELGATMVRSAYSGVSGVVDPAGRVTHRAELFERSAVVVVVPVVDVSTVYERFGGWFVALCGGGLAVFGLGSRLRTRRPPSTPGSIARVYSEPLAGNDDRCGPRRRTCTTSRSAVPWAGYAQAPRAIGTTLEPDSAATCSSTRRPTAAVNAGSPSSGWCSEVWRASGPEIPRLGDA